jgi:hypothetical protein
MSTMHVALIIGFDGSGRDSIVEHKGCTNRIMLSHVQNRRNMSSGSVELESFKVFEAAHEA